MLKSRMYVNAGASPGLCLRTSVFAAELWLSFGPLRSLHLHIRSWDTPPALREGRGFLPVSVEMHEADEGGAEALQSYLGRDLCQ